MNERVDVLVPVYNSAKFIKKCINSIQKQTYQNLNIIVVNDGSKDNSYEILESMAKEDKRIKLYSKENERYVAITRNYLLSKIESDYFIFVDSDDRVSPYYIEHLMTALKETDSDMACCEYTIIKGKYSHSKKIKGLITLESKDAIPAFVLGNRGHFMLWNKLIKTKLLADIRFDTSMHFGEDMFFVCDILKQNNFKIASIKNKLYFYKVVNFHSISKGGLNNSKKGFLENLIKIEQEERYGSDTDVLTTWIYITAKLYRFLTVFRRKHREYRKYLNNIIKERKQHYKQDKRVPFKFRFLLIF